MLGPRDGQKMVPVGRLRRGGRAEPAALRGGQGALVVTLAQLALSSYILAYVRGHGAAAARAEGPALVELGLSCP